MRFLSQLVSLFLWASRFYAVVNLKGSEVMTGADASPIVKAPVNQAGGRVRYWSDTVETNADDSVNSTYLLARLPSNAIILPSSKIHVDDLATAGAPTLDIGIFNRSGKSDITDDDNAIATGVDAATAGATGLNQTITNFGKELWELLASPPSKDPGVDLDIKATLKAAAINQAGTITIELYYTVD